MSLKGHCVVLEKKFKLFKYFNINKVIIRAVKRNILLTPLMFLTRD